MGIVSNLRQRFGSQPSPRKLGESDAPADTATSRTRGTGGEPQADAQNPNASTGTTPNDTYVGRPGADETMDTGVSGAEARAGQSAEGRGQGAARDD